MTDDKMIISRMLVTENELKISAAIRCDENANAIPKVKMMFECNGKTRCLPFFVKSCFKQKEDNKCIIICEYTYFVDYLFFNYDGESDIHAWVELQYGDKKVEKLAFMVSSNVLNENPDIAVDERYVDYDCFSGVTVFDKIDEKERELLQKKGNRDSFFVFSFDFENNTIIISKNSRYKKNHAKMAVVMLVRFIFFVFRVAAAIALAPYFVLDGIAAALKITPKRPTKPIEGFLRNSFVQVKINFSSFLKTSFKKANVINRLRKPLSAVFNAFYRLIAKKRPIVQNRITFMSGRRDELSGNSAYVYDLLKDNPDVEFRFLLFSNPKGHSHPKNIIKFLHLYATSRIVLVADYFRLLNIVNKREGVKLFQLWHACGAFKTFGFTRLGKAGGPQQIDPNHRMYDYAIVSSKEVAPHYAEGFGLSQECVVPTGIPRTDIFMDSDYAAEAKRAFYEKRPQLKDKKIILFAPTFRGNGQISAYYPLDAFHPEKLYEALGGEYAILIKLHPFCEERYEISEQYQDMIIDLSEEDELNDLLFVTDLLITDYSSVVFEASLLDIPMLFYAYDLYDYISNRDFYYDFESFVPGKIVFSESDLIQSIKREDFEHEKVDEFKNKFFDNLDGLSSQRVANLILDTMRGEL